MGYHFGPEGLDIAQKTLDNFVERAIRLYEQGPGEPCGSTRLGEYAKRWVRWAGAGFVDIDREIDGLQIYGEVFEFRGEVSHRGIYGEQWGIYACTPWFQ